MTRKFLVLLAAIWAFLAMQGPLLAGELALEVASRKKHSAARRFLTEHGTIAKKVEAKDFGLPPGPALRAVISMGRDPRIPVTLLFTNSKQAPGQVPDELRVAMGKVTDLSTVKPFAASPVLYSRGRAQTKFKNVQFSFTHEGQEYPLTMDVTFDGAVVPSQRSSAMYKINSVRAGQVELDGKMVKVLLIDRNGNGLFDDRASPGGRPGQGDLLLIDLNGNDRMEQLPGQTYQNLGGEVFPLTSLARINSRYYSYVLPPSGASLTLKPIEPTLGNIRGSRGNLKLQLLGPVWLNIAGDQLETIAVPEGKYTILQLSEERQDKSGRKWSLDTSKAGPAGFLEVKAGQTVSLPQMDPIKVNAQIHQSGKNGRRISAQFQTAQGLMITDAKMGNKQPKAPTYEIHDSSGKLVASGKLKYG